MQRRVYALAGIVIECSPARRPRRRHGSSGFTWVHKAFNIHASPRACVYIYIYYISTCGVRPSGLIKPRRCRKAGCARGRGGSCGAAIRGAVRPLELPQNVERALICVGRFVLGSAAPGVKKTTKKKTEKETEASQRSRATIPGQPAPASRSGGATPGCNRFTVFKMSRATQTQNYKRWGPKWPRHA